MNNIDYEPNVIEPKWQRYWEENKVFSPDLDKAQKPYYNLMMFPYPSAEGLHVGNMYAFTGADVYARFQRMKGNDVFEPIGLDGFGIHSENYALKIGAHPMEQAEKSAKNFYRQLRSIGNSYDWTRTLVTYDPDYYKWTQWIFTQMFKSGLAYRKKAQVNWCPSCATVLSDEQVISGECERCGTQVVKRDLEQWFFRITEYAERLLRNLDTLDWTEKVKIAQRNWIGRSDGARIEFKVQPFESTQGESEKFKFDDIEVFTTRPDTLFGATFLVLSPEHPLVAELLNSKFKIQNSKLDEVKKYVEAARKKTDQERVAEGKEKTGVFTGMYAINPINNEEIPIWIADYVLMGYGTGAIMAVPAHDERDFEFAKKYGLRIVQVIQGQDDQQGELTEAYVGEGQVINSGDWNGWTYPEGKEKVIQWLEEKGIGKRETNYHLRDWLISRQRYWGPPIPMVFCKTCADAGRSWFTSKEAQIYHESGIKNQESSKKENNLNSLFVIHNSSDMAGWYPEENLPVLLPKVKDYKPMGTGKAPLANHPDFYETICPECGSPAVRETDVSDTFLDSAWYYFRYLCTECKDIPFPMKESGIKNQESGKEENHNSLFVIHNSSQRLRWLPINIYIGGAEHSVLHLLYSRFMTMFLYDLRYIGFEEPFARFYAHGLLIKEGHKMSKSKGNIIIPDEYINKYGSDTLRTYLMFLGPFSQGGDFYDSGIEGMARFIRRVWKLFSEFPISPSLRSGQANSNPPVGGQISNERLTFMHKTIKRVTEDIEGLRYNTAIAGLMEWYNFLNEKLKMKNEKLTEEEIIIFLKLLAPFAPFMTEELWHSMELRIKNKESGKEEQNHNSSFVTHDSIHKQPWPTYEEKYLVEDQVTVVIQVNGKRRGELSIPNDQVSNKEEVEKLAKEKAEKYLEGKEIRKVVYVPGKVINFVV